LSLFVPALLVKLNDLLVQPLKLLFDVLGHGVSTLSRQWADFAFADEGSPIERVGVLSFTTNCASLKASAQGWPARMHR
jgi:hypothetical protein